MSRRSIPTVAIAAILSLAACSPAATTAPSPAPPASAPAASEPAASEPPASAPVASASAPAAGGAACTPSATAGTVQAGMAGTAFVPAEITAKVGDTITWTDSDTLPHTATLKDDPACTTDILPPGSTGNLTFSAAGTYALICKIHSTMSATVTITQ